jgi:hypothetical protein
MKVTTKGVYWTTTGAITLVMLFSIYMMFGPLWQHLAFPTYFRIELLVAKLVGLVALLLPSAPARLKEWAYAGFGIILVSASFAHARSGDPLLNIVEPLGFLCILLVSNVSWHRLAR